MAADRGAYIDQSQSFNAFMATPTKAKVTSMHFYSWKKGLKTGIPLRPLLFMIRNVLSPHSARCYCDPIYRRQVEVGGCYPLNERKRIVTNTRT